MGETNGTSNKGQFNTNWLYFNRYFMDGKLTVGEVKDLIGDAIEKYKNLDTFIKTSLNASHQQGKGDDAVIIDTTPNTRSQNQTLEEYEATEKQLEGLVGAIKNDAKDQVVKVKFH